MEKIVNVNFDQGMDSMVRVLNYFRRKEIGITSIDMKRTGEDDIIARISFHESISEDKILSHFEKLYDVKSIELV